MVSWIPNPTQEGIVGSIFPTIKSKSLAKNSVNLPQDAKGKITLITIGFKEKSQPQIDSWAKPFLEKYYDKNLFDYYEVPMISSRATYFGLMNKVIDNGMRAGIEKKMHPNVITFYGNLKPYYKSLHIKDKNLAYIFLLDKTGVVRFASSNFMGQAGWNELEKIITKYQ